MLSVYLEKLSFSFETPLWKELSLAPFELVVEGRDAHALVPRPVALELVQFSSFSMGSFLLLLPKCLSIFSISLALESLGALEASRLPVFLRDVSRMDSCYGAAAVVSVAFVS